MDQTDTRRLLILEDDEAFARTLARSFTRRGYRVEVGASADALDPLLRSHRPTHAVVDLKLGNTSGLDCVKALHDFDPTMRIVVLTGYASIATAVRSIKLGACHYLPKPSNADEIEAAFGDGESEVDAPIGNRPTSLKTWEWERINEALAESGFNISETARRLGMHRRTLARKLEKRPVR